MTALAARCELRGGARQPSGFNNSARGVVSAVLSRRLFRLASWGVFYPLAGGAADSGAAQFDRLGPPAGASPVLFRDIVVFFFANDGARAIGANAAAGAAR